MDGLELKTGQALFVKPDGKRKPIQIGTYAGDSRFGKVLVNVPEKSKRRYGTHPAIYQPGCVVWLEKDTLWTG